MCVKVNIDSKWCDTIGTLRGLLPDGAVVAKDSRCKKIGEADDCLCGVDVWSTLEPLGYKCDYDPFDNEWKAVKVG